MKNISKNEQFRNVRTRLLNKDFTLPGHWIYNTLYLLLHQKGPSFCLCVSKFPNNLFSRTLTYRKISKLRFQVYKFCDSASWEKEREAAENLSRSHKPYSSTASVKQHFTKNLTFSFIKKSLKRSYPSSNSLVFLLET